jgi:hypothetical protein
VDLWDLCRYKEEILVMGWKLQYLNKEIKIATVKETESSFS